MPVDEVGLNPYMKKTKGILAGVNRQNTRYRDCHLNIIVATYPAVDIAPWDRETFQLCLNNLGIVVGEKIEVNRTVSSETQIEFSSSK